MIACVSLIYVLLVSSASFKLIVTNVTCAPAATVFFLDHLLSDFINFTIL